MEKSTDGGHQKGTGSRSFWCFCLKRTKSKVGVCVRVCVCVCVYLDWYSSSAMQGKRIKSHLYGGADFDEESKIKSTSYMKELGPTEALYVQVIQICGLCAAEL